jgi:hypothetical protein
LPNPSPHSTPSLASSARRFISLVWIGTILIVVGIAVAVFLRRKDIATTPVEG